MNSPTLSPVSSSPLQPLLVSITAIENVAPHHFLFSLRAPKIAQTARAGQFIHVLPRSSQLFDPFLRRAFSLLAAREEEIDILFRVEGNGTAQIAEKRVGDTLDVLGPLGCAFDTALFHVKQKFNPIPLKPILVGGGVGVPPLVFLGKTFVEAGYAPLMLLGARSASEVLGVKLFDQLHIETRISTDDGSLGQTGRVTELLSYALERDRRAVIYACGPLPMLRAVAGVAARYGAPCQVSLEENMPCGIGVCNGCVVAIKENRIGDQDEKRANNASDYGRYQRICVVGPALWADKIDWEAL